MKNEEEVVANFIEQEIVHSQRYESYRERSSRLHETNIALRRLRIVYGMIVITTRKARSYEK